MDRPSDSDNDVWGSHFVLEKGGAGGSHKDPYKYHSGL